MDYLSELPKTDLLALLEIASEAREARTVDQYQDCFSKMEMLVQFDAALSIYADKVAVDNHKIPTYFHYPFKFSGEFLQRYAQDLYFEESPVFQAAYKTLLPQHWKTAWTSGEYGNGTKSMQLAQTYGYEDGWAVAFNNKKLDALSFFAFGGRLIENDQRTSAILRYITPHFAESLRGLFQVDLVCRQATEKSNITGRELEILKWLQSGKTAWETAAILNRSERVVKWHLGNIQRKLDAVNRTHAVAVALRRGIIT
jgi:DNA-binding CsgD family transcriptional regulator